MIIEKRRLPRPYETRCVDFGSLGFQNQHHCIEDCINMETLSTLGKVNIFSPVTEHSNLTILSFSQLGQQNTSLMLWQIQKNCQSQCNNSDCYDEEVITITDSSLQNGTCIIWNHLVISQISFKITSRAALTFVEFFVYILGSVSTWTGLSIVACNPVVLVKYLPKQSQNRNPGTQAKKDKRRRRLATRENHQIQLQNLSRNTAIANAQQ